MDAKAKRALIPVDDLQLQGQVPTQLDIGQDVLPVLAILAGVGDTTPKLASLTDTGVLRTADVGAGFSRTDAKEGSVMNGAAVVAFGEMVMSVVINIDTQQCTIEHSRDGQTYDPPQTVLAGEKLTMDAQTRAIRVTNTSGTTATGYRIWGLYF